MRVVFPDPTGKYDTRSGTVVEVRADTRQGNVLVCTDLPHDQFQDHPHICGERHGLELRSKYLRAYAASSSENEYHGVPAHIGLCAAGSFSYEGMKFPSHSVGRIKKFSNAYVCLDWFVGPLKGSGNHYIPKKFLSWCRFDPDTNHRINYRWYRRSSTGDKLPESREGDILIYQSEKPISIPGYAVTPGVLFKHLGVDADGCCIKAQIVSGVPVESLGESLQLRAGTVRKFEGPFIFRGTRVEITAEVMFRKRRLQGAKAQVILSTDCDGDIGVQLPEDIGAGSLDGVGKEGHCLYVPTDAVKEISE